MRYLQKQSVQITFAIFLIISVFTLMLYRSTLGVDFSDESYHLATAYHFFQGAKAFVDELYVIQSFAFVTTPIFSFLLGSHLPPEAIVLKMRAAFLVFQFLVSCVLFACVRKRFSFFVSLFSTFFFLFYVPMNLFSLFYVTLGVGFTSLGIGFCFLSESNVRPKLMLILASISLALATLSHPVMFLPAFYLFSRMAWRTFHKSVKSFSCFFLPILFFLLVWIFVIFKYQFTPQDYLHSFRGIRPDIWTLKRVWDSIKVLAIPGPAILLLFLWLSIFLIGFFRPSPKSDYRNLILLVCLPVLLFFHCRTSQGGLGPCGYLMTIFYFAPFLCLFSDRKFSKIFLFDFWIPAMLTALGLAFGSYSGPSSISAGFLAVLPFGTAFLLGSNERLSMKGSPRLFKFTSPLIFLELITIFLLGLFGSAFQETPLSTLRATIGQGPFKGLKTSTEKRDFINELQDTLNSNLPKQGRIVFSCFFPAGYLLTPLTPNHSFLYTVPELSTIHPSTDVVVRLFDDTYPQLGLWPQNCPPLTETIAGNPGRIIKKKGYEIWVRNTAEKPI